MKLHEGYDQIKIARGIINLTINELLAAEKVHSKLDDTHAANRCKLLVRALKTALENSHD